MIWFGLFLSFESLVFVFASLHSHLSPSSPICRPLYRSVCKWDCQASNENVGLQTQTLDFQMIGKAQPNHIIVILIMFTGWHTQICCGSVNNQDQDVYKTCTLN